MLIQTQQSVQVSSLSNTPSILRLLHWRQELGPTASWGLTTARVFMASKTLALQKLQETVLDHCQGKPKLHTQTTSCLRQGSHSHSDPALSLPCISAGSSSIHLPVVGCVLGQGSKEAARASRPTGKALGLRVTARQRGHLPPALSPCAPIPQPRGNTGRGEDRQGVSRFLPRMQQAALPYPSLPRFLPHASHGTAQAVLLGTVTLSGKGTCGKHHRQGRGFLWGKMATGQLQNVLTSAAGRGPEGSPLPSARSPEPKGTAAIVRQDWMLPCIHVGLMKAHSSEEKYLHSASQVVTFAQMTHKQAAPPLPFPTQTSSEGSGRRGAAGAAEQSREQNANKSASQPFSPPLCGVNGKCHFTC